MKKFVSILMLTALLSSSMPTPANAGILILTGDIGHKFDGYKVVGWLTIILTGVSVLGLVVDGNEQVDSSVKLPELSEASLSLIQNATSGVASAAVSAQKSVITTIDSKLATNIVSLEGLTNSVEGDLLFKTLTTK